jgi:hypothetical protein
MSNNEQINITSADNSGKGDDLRIAFTKINNNFQEVFSVIDYDTDNTVLTLADNTSSFQTSLTVSGGLTVDQDVVLLANISAIADGGTF